MIKTETYRPKHTVKAFVFDGSCEDVEWLENLSNCTNFFKDTDEDGEYFYADVSNDWSEMVEVGNVPGMSRGHIFQVYPDMETFLQQHDEIK